MPLLRIQYCSIPIGQDARDIVAILGAARVRNARLGLSGLLGTSPTHFLQMIEGEERPVRAVYDSIVADPRHRIVWSAQEHVARRFVLPRLPMGHLQDGEHGFTIECGAPEACCAGMDLLVWAGRRKYARCLAARQAPVPLPAARLPSAAYL